MSLKKFLMKKGERLEMPKGAHGKQTASHEEDVLAPGKKLPKVTHRDQMDSVQDMDTGEFNHDLDADEGNDEDSKELARMLEEVKGHDAKRRSMGIRRL